MDTKKLIEAKLTALPKDLESSGLRAILGHLDSAEKHYVRGCQEGDDALFNDVIYRTNQAFEGSLRDAYTLLQGPPKANLTTAEIERYLSTTLHDRVRNFFKGYRQEWRNPSTHDHALIFKESEAVLALLSVTSFFVVLLDQILEHVERKKAAAIVAPSRRRLGSKEPSLMELITDAAMETIEFSRVQVDLSERQLAGYLAGRLEVMDHRIEIQPDPSFKDSKGAVRRPDLIVRRTGRPILIEVRQGDKLKTKQGGLAQILSYCRDSDFEKAVLIILSKGSTPPTSERRVEQAGSKQVDVAICE